MRQLRFLLLERCPWPKEQSTVVLNVVALHGMFVALCDPSPLAPHPPAHSSPPKSSRYDSANEWSNFARRICRKAFFYANTHVVSRAHRIGIRDACGGERAR